MAEGWTYDDEPKRTVVTNVKKAPKAPAASLGELAYNLGQDIVPTFQEAYSRATDASGAGTGETGALIRGLTDLFNLDDRFQQAQGLGNAQQREDLRDANQVRKVREMRAVWSELDKLNPAWREDSALSENIARLTGSFLGDMAGNANPTYLIGGGRTALGRAGVQGSVNAGIDAALQASELNSGITDEFDPRRTALQFLAGAAIQGGGEAVARSLGLGSELPFTREEIAGDPASDIKNRWAQFWRANEEHKAQTGENAPNFETISKEFEDLYRQYVPDEDFNPNWDPTQGPIVVEGQRPVSSDYGADSQFNEADEAFTNALVTGETTPEIEAVVRGMEAETGAVPDVTPESPPVPAGEVSDALVQLRKIANDMHMDAEIEGGKYPLGQLVAIHRKVTEGLDAGKFQGADLEEANNIKAFLDEAIVWRDQTQRVIDAEAGMADRAPPATNALERFQMPEIQATQRPFEANDEIPVADGNSGDIPPPDQPPLSGGDGGEPPRPVSERLTEALNNAKRVTKEQRELYRQERANRLKNVIAAREAGSGEEGFRAELGALKGEMERVDYEGVRDQFTPEEVDGLFDEIKTSDAFGRSLYEPITARTGLGKILDGKVPAPSEVAALEKVFGKEFTKAVSQHRSRGGKAADLFTNALNLPRSLMASMDLSAPFRQGVFLVGSKQFWKAWPEMFKAFGSERAFKGIMDDIRSRETFPLMEEANLGITDLGGNLSNREEDFISQWAERLPIIGRGVKASERAYVGFLNKLRADTFDSLVRKYGEAGIDLTENAKAVKDMGSFINNATGRGDLGKQANAAAGFLNGIFFSPRLIASRINLLNPVTYVKLDPIVRKEALKSLISFGAIATTVAALASQAGYDVETDPRSSDFAKIKDGNTRYDILGGFGQYLTLGARLATNETKTLKGDVKELGKGYKADTRVDVIERFLENKFAPVPGYIRDFLAGKDPVGNEFEVGRDTAELFIPLLWQDIAEMYEEEGLAGIAKGAPGIFGIGTSTYTARRTSQPDVEEDTPTEEPQQSLTMWTYDD